MKWRILNKSIETHPNKADAIIKAVCILHNSVMDKENTIIKDNDEIDESPDSLLSDVHVSRRNNRCTVEAVSVRNAYKKYF